VLVGEWHRRLWNVNESVSLASAGTSRFIERAPGSSLRDRETHFVIAAQGWRSKVPPTSVVVIPAALQSVVY
jgi:hypothetical protein